MDRNLLIRLILRLLRQASEEQLLWIYSFLRGFLP